MFEQISTISEGVQAVHRLRLLPSTDLQPVAHHARLYYSYIQARSTLVTQARCSLFASDTVADAYIAE